MFVKKKKINITVSLHIILKLKAKNIILNRPIDYINTAALHESCILYTE